MTIDISLAAGIALALIAATYGITAWAHRKNAPAVVQRAAAAIDDVETRIESAAESALTTARRVEPVIKADIDKAVTSVEDEAWNILNDMIAKVASLEAKKKTVADAQADLDAHVKRVAAMKAAVASLPAA